MCRYLARDIQSVTGKNLQFVQDLTNLDPWTTGNGKLKAALVTAEMVEVPQRERERVVFIQRSPSRTCGACPTCALSWLREVKPTDQHWNLKKPD